MHPEIKIRLKDIELSIKEIHDFLPNDITYKEFQSDIKTRKAIERNLGIIGEAMRRIKELNPDFIVTDSRKIIDTRNRIIHGYNSVSADVIWLIINHDLPLLEKEISELLK